jgi:hypothetical protein
VTTLVAINANDIMVALIVGSGGVYVRRESGVRLSFLCWCDWQGSGFGHCEDVFTLKFNL